MTTLPASERPLMSLRDLIESGLVDIDTDTFVLGCVTLVEGEAKGEFGLHVQMDPRDIPQFRENILRMIDAMLASIPANLPHPAH